MKSKHVLIGILVAVIFVITVFAYILERPDAPSAVGSVTLSVPDKKLPEGNIALKPDVLKLYLDFKQKQTELEVAKHTNKAPQMVPYTVQLREDELDGFGNRVNRALQMSMPQGGYQFDPDTVSWKKNPPPPPPVPALPGGKR